MQTQQEVSWGWLGADPVNRLVLDGTFQGHAAHADVTFSGDEEEVDWFADDGDDTTDLGSEEEYWLLADQNPLSGDVDDFGWNPFRSVARAAKAVARTAAHASKVVKPWVQRGAIGLSVVFPPAAPIAAGVAAAVTAVAAADGKIPKGKGAKRNKAIKKVKKARAIIVNTAKMAKKGGAGAKRAIKVMKVVRKARKAAQARGHKRAWTVTRKGFVLRVL